MLSRDQARAFYDRFGAKQDKQAYYEDPALEVLLARGEFSRARAVFEFGCGTGRFARRLLATMPDESAYTGTDLSHTMIGLARDRLAPFAQRARVSRSDGSPKLALENDSMDRFVSTYVLDLLPCEEIEAVLGEARRILNPDGLLCLVGITHGRGLLPRFVSICWRLLHALVPKLVGGCRPIRLHHYVTSDSWVTVHHQVVTAYAVSSEVLIARKRQALGLLPEVLD